MPPPRKPIIWVHTPRWMTRLTGSQFCKDIGSQTIAGFIVVGAGYLFGIGPGTIPPPTNKNFVFDVVIVAVSFISSLVLTFVLAIRIDMSGPSTARPLVIPAPGDIFRQHFWNSKPWWKRAFYPIARWLVLLLPIWGTLALSALLWLLFAP